MNLTDVSVDKRCPDDCGCLEIDGGLSPDSCMWTHENVDIVLLKDEDKRGCRQNGDYRYSKPGDEYVDLFLPCGTVVGYVEIEQLLNEDKTRLVERIGISGVKEEDGGICFVFLSRMGGASGTGRFVECFVEYDEEEDAVILRGNDSECGRI